MVGDEIVNAIRKAAVIAVCREGDRRIEIDELTNECFLFLAERGMPGGPKAAFARAFKHARHYAIKPLLGLRRTSRYLGCTNGKKRIETIWVPNTLARIPFETTERRLHPKPPGIRTEDPWPIRKSYPSTARRPVPSRASSRPSTTPSASSTRMASRSTN
jgi:hypothetical protein